MLITSITILFALLGLLTPFWGFFLIAIVVASVRGGVLVLALSVLADCMYGPPVGFLHPLVMPFTLLSIMLLLVRLVFVRAWRAEVPVSL